VVDHLLRVVAHDERPLLKVAEPVEGRRLDPRRELERVHQLAQRVLRSVVGEVDREQRAARVAAHAA
jgi:hypothetical protein